MTQIVPCGAQSQFFVDEFQRGLARWNRERLAPGFPDEEWPARIDRDMRMLRLEIAFVEALRREVAEWAATAPSDADGFVAWFESLRDVGPGQGDALFPWLADHASLDQL